jgi:signal peptidase I
MLKGSFSRSVRYSVYFVAAWGWITAINKLVGVSRVRIAYIISTTYSLAEKLTFLFTQVSGTSMLPHLQEGDWIFKESITSRFFSEEEPYRVGDVIVFKSPWNKEAQNVKRVIALVCLASEHPILRHRIARIVF